MENPQAVLTELETIRTQTLQYLDALTQAQLDWRPARLHAARRWQRYDP